MARIQIQPSFLAAKENNNDSEKYSNFVAVVECHLCDQELGLYLFPVIHQLGFDHSV